MVVRNRGISVLHANTEMLFLHLLALGSLKVASITTSGGHVVDGQMNGHFKNGAHGT